MIRRKLNSLFHPENYHGWGISTKFFEGWYYKIVNADESQAFAIIPGIAMDINGKKQAFIQVLDGKNKTAEYIKFPAEEFIASPKDFEVTINNNSFTRNSVKINLDFMQGDLRFGQLKPWPNKWYSPGIMGPFSFVPFMECYHGILSLDHEIQGKLVFRNKEIDFSGGRGYMEKDWGKSFPEAYCWMQSNHFSEREMSVKASVAQIPWMGSSFTGFIAGVYFEKKLYQFTTYNRSKLIHCDPTNHEVKQVFENTKYALELRAIRDEATSLPSPILGLMDGKIEESMTSTIYLKLTDKRSKKVIVEDQGRNACLEVAGKVENITIK